MLNWIFDSLDSLKNTCWTCPLFDNLFRIISESAAVIYDKLTIFCVIIFCILFGFYIFSTFWKNMEKGFQDTFLQKSIKPVLIKSLLVLSLLTLGLTVPKFISKITFEPVATITLEYAKAILPNNAPIESNYQSIQLSQDGFFSITLRDTLLQLIQSSLFAFQTYIQFGIKVMDEAFSLRALLNVISLVKHLIIFFMGLFLTFNFFKLFVKYSFCFLDIIIAMAKFAFFFPISLVLFIFKDAENLPSWMKSLGGNLGAGQIKNLINAIVSVASNILTYTIIIMVTKGFLDSNGFDPNSSAMDYESLFELDLDHADATQLTFLGFIVLIYVLKYIADQVPKITEKIMSAFGVSQEDSLSKDMGEKALNFADMIKEKAKQAAKDFISPAQGGDGATPAKPTK